MKHLYTKGEFITLRNGDEMINEGLFQFLGKMFNKAKAYINKTKGGKEVQAIYDEYKKIISDEFKKKAQVDLHLGAEDQLKTENYMFYKLNEDVNSGSTNSGNTTPEQNNNKISAKALLSKQAVLQEIINRYKNIALKKMDQILAKYGGAEKNPKLAIIINNKKDQFDLDFMNAKIKYLEQGGDKNAANKIATERNKLAKELDARWNLDRAEHVEIELDGKKYKIGIPYRYTNDQGKLRTIKLVKKSDNPNNVIAFYTYGTPSEKNKQKEFTIANIDIENNPEVGSEYKYFSIDNRNEITVKILEAPDAKDMIKVENTDGNGTPFKIYRGALLEKQ